MKRSGIAGLAVLLFALQLQAQAPSSGMEESRFSQRGLQDWKQKQFRGETRYRLVDAASGEVEAVSEGSASALYRPMKVDLERTPWLHWRWQKRLPIEPGDENRKQGDDFVARVYVVKKGGLLFWKTLAINYVWSADHRKGEAWDNPFAGRNARMLSVRDASDPAGRWFEEKRNVAEDFQRLFGQSPGRIDGIAIMTDSDNSGLRAEALYGDLWFSAD